MRPYILVAEDDEDDFQFFMESFELSNTKYEVRWMKDGEECINFLHKQESNLSSENFYLPNMIFLDLNMPRKNGLEVLREIRSNKSLHHIPVIILSSSNEREIVNQSYQFGVSAFIQKLPNRTQFANNLDALIKFWFKVVQLPESCEKNIKTTQIRLKKNSAVTH
ncbi:MAG: response regulator [Nitrospina sp.]|jgi:CheY-like chemotaxis protein|nr:response regulator [Nitrospina sp.]MBT5633935.1 response regulator [Nitrospina sp.]